MNNRLAALFLGFGLSACRDNHEASPESVRRETNMVVVSSLSNYARLNIDIDFGSAFNSMKNGGEAFIEALKKLYDSKKCVLAHEKSEERGVFLNNLDFRDFSCNLDLFLSYSPSLPEKNKKCGIGGWFYEVCILEKTSESQRRRSFRRIPLQKSLKIEILRDSLLANESNTESYCKGRRDFIDNAIEEAEEVLGKMKWEWQAHYDRMIQDEDFTLYLNRDFEREKEKILDLERTKERIKKFIE
jgi:hypothetical protein